MKAKEDAQRKKEEAERPEVDDFKNYHPAIR